MFEKGVSEVWVAAILLNEVCGGSAFAWRGEGVEITDRLVVPFIKSQQLPLEELYNDC